MKKKNFTREQAAILVTVLSLGVVSWQGVAGLAAVVGREVLGGAGLAVVAEVFVVVGRGWVHTHPHPHTTPPCMCR